MASNLTLCKLFKQEVPQNIKPRYQNKNQQKNKGKKRKVTRNNSKMSFGFVNKLGYSFNTEHSFIPNNT